MESNVRASRFSWARTVGIMLAALLLLSVILPLHAEADAASSAGQEFAASVPGRVTGVAMSDDGVMVAGSSLGSAHFYTREETEGSAWHAPRAGPLKDVVPSVDFVGVSTDGAVRYAAANWATFTDGTVYAFGSAAFPVWSYEVASTGSMLEPNTVTALATSSGQTYVGVGTEAGEVVLLKGDETGNPKLPAEIFTSGEGGVDLGPIRALALGRDANRVLAGTEDDSGATLHLFDRHYLLASFEEVPGPVRAVAISSDSLYGVAAIGGSQNRVVVLDLQAKSILWDWIAPAAVNDVAISAGGATIAAGLANGAVALFTKKATFNAWKVPVLQGLGNPIVSVDVDDDGRHVAVVTKNGKVSFLSPAIEGALWSFDLHRDASALSMAPSNEFIALGTEPSGDDSGQAVYFAARRAADVTGQTTYDVLPGKTIDGALSIANHGNRVEGARITGSGLGDGWTLTLSEGPYTVPPGRTVTVGYTLKPSLYARPGSESFDLDVRFEDVGARVLAVTANVLETRGVAIDVAARELTVRAGASGQVEFVLVNMGNVQEAVKLKATGVPAATTVSWSPSSTLSLGPYGTREIALRLQPAQNVADTDVPVTLTATSNSNEAQEQVRFKVLGATGLPKTIGAADGLDGSGDDDASGDGRAAAEGTTTVNVNGDQASKKKGKKVPGFEGVAVFVALAAALLVAGRNRRSK